MRRNRLGNASLEVSEICLGTMTWGEQNSEAEAHAQLDFAVSRGVNFIDTAEMYPVPPNATTQGRTEAFLGRWLEKRGRDGLVIATKIAGPGRRDWIRDGRTDITRETIAEAVGTSLARLKLDRIDLYQIHWPNPVVPLGAQMEGMRRLQDDGLVHHVGVSNFSRARWESAETALGRPVLSNQVQFSLLVPKPARELVPYAREHDRLVIAYSPLAKGLLGGRYDADHLPGGSARTMDPLWLPENVRRAGAVIEVVRRIADAHGATPAQVALAWLVSHPNVVVIPGASSVEQLRRNVEAADLELPDGELEELTAASDAFEPIGKPAMARGYARALTGRN